MNEIVDIVAGFSVTFEEDEFVETKAGLEELKGFCEVYKSLMTYLQKSANDITTHPFKILQTFEDLIGSLTDAEGKFARILKHFDCISILQVSMKMKPPLDNLATTLKRLILAVTEVCISNVDPNGDIGTASTKLRDYLLEFIVDLRRIFIALKPIKLYNEKSIKLIGFLDSLLQTNGSDTCVCLFIEQLKFRRNIDISKSEKIHQTLIDTMSTTFFGVASNRTPTKKQLFNNTVDNLIKWESFESDVVQEITILVENATRALPTNLDFKKQISQDSKLFFTLFLSNDIRFTYTWLTDKLSENLEQNLIVVECNTDYYPTMKIVKIYGDSIFQFSKSIRQSTNLTATLTQITTDIIRLQKTVVNLKKDIILQIKSNPFIPQTVNNPLKSINFDDVVSPTESFENNFL